MSAFSDWFRRSLKNQGLAQQAFGRSVGITQSAVSHYLADRAPPPVGDDLEPWLDLLQVPVADRPRIHILACIAHLPKAVQPQFEKLYEEHEKLKLAIYSLPKRKRKVR